MKWITPIIFTDVFIFPMFHFNDVPFKLSFIYLLLWAVYKRPNAKYAYPFYGLIISLWIGKLNGYYTFDLFGFDKTIFMTVNYMVILLGLLYGLSMNHNNMNWLFRLILMYTLVNIIIMVFWKSNEFIINFYSLQFRIDQGLFAYRNPGVFSNPNVSALGSNILILFWIIAKKKGLISEIGNIYEAIVFTCGFVLAISFGSKSGFSAYLILFLYNTLKLRSYSVWKSAIVVALIIVFLMIINSYMVRYEVGSYKTGVSTLLSMNEKIQYEIDKDSSQDGSRIFKINHGIHLWMLAPLLGMGSDRNGSGVVSQIQYHNDWTEVLVSSGLIGILFLIIIVYNISRLSFILLIPFIFPGLTNSFLFTAQIAMAYYIFVGLIVRSDKVSFEHESSAQTRAEKHDSNSNYFRNIQNKQH